MFVSRDSCITRVISFYMDDLLPLLQLPRKFRSQISDLKTGVFTLKCDFL
jgi:hypothetical protein